MQNKKNRRKSRAIAMELLYSETINARSEEINDDFLDEFTDISETRDTLDRQYISTVTKIAAEKEAYLKDVIRPYLKEWTLERISRVNLAILKVAVAEILFMDDIPERVSLNEALELSKIYSDEESTSFINGILDKVLKAKQSGSLPEEKTEEITEEKTEEITEEKALNTESSDAEHSKVEPFEPPSAPDAVEPKPVVETPEVPEVGEPQPEVPEVEKPQPEVPEVEKPQPEIPEVEEPKPEVEEPKPEVPEVEEPKPGNPEVKEPKPKVPEVGTPEPEIPEIEEPKPEIPEVGKPQPEIPEVETPNPEIPEVSPPVSPEVNTPGIEL